MTKQTKFSDLESKNKAVKWFRSVFAICGVGAAMAITLCVTDLKGFVESAHKQGHKRLVNAVERFEDKKSEEATREAIIGLSLLFCAWAALMCRVTRKQRNDARQVVIDNIVNPNTGLDYSNYYPLAKQLAEKVFDCMDSSEQRQIEELINNIKFNLSVGKQPQEYVNKINDIVNKVLTRNSQLRVTLDDIKREHARIVPHGKPEGRVYGA